jgi:hypothetical protein
VNRAKGGAETAFTPPVALRGSGAGGRTSQAAIVDRKVVGRILTHLGLPARALALCPAREDQDADRREDSDPP